MNNFQTNGFCVIDLGATQDLTDIRKLFLNFLNTILPETIDSLENYHQVALSSEEHEKVHYKLTQFYWDQKLWTKIMRKKINLFKSLIGQDLHIQKYPYLRLARPKIAGDNIGYHRDTWYGSSPFEVSVIIPFTPMTIENTLSFIPGSNVASESSYPYIQYEDEDIKKGSTKHQLGFLYAPKLLNKDISKKVVQIPVDVGQALIFSLSIIHGQIMNQSKHTRFSTDVRLVNSLAPIQWERNVRADYYESFCKSPVTEQAEMYVRNNKVA